MELQFDNVQCAYLNQIISQAQKQEQTQELRITDDMPDIGRILGCWGQIMIRSKEWRNGEISASGGVKVWTLYVGENGEEPICMDGWIPFQMRWPIPDTQHDGQIQLHPFIQELECRSVGARKMMVRLSVCVHAKAFERAHEQIATPTDLPEHMYIRKCSYPLELPVEAGEKIFAISDDFALPDGAAPIAKIVRFEVCPQIREQKVLSGKVIFRGGYTLHLLYICTEGKLHTWKTEGAFSQFADLDKDYSTAAMVNTSLLVTLAELDLNEDGAVQLKCGMCCQYIIYDRTTVEVADDAYSSQRHLKIRTEQLNLPVRLDHQMQNIPFDAFTQVDAHRVVDCNVMWHMPLVSVDDERVGVLLEGIGQLLYLDEQGKLQGATASVKEQWSMLSDPVNRVDAAVVSILPESEVQPGGVELAGELQLDVSVSCARGIPVITGIESGELKNTDPDRPSVILRRVGNDSVWDIAKNYNSTVERICEANALEGDPNPDKMLLIPVN